MANTSPATRTVIPRSPGGQLLTAGASQPSGLYLQQNRAFGSGSTPASSGSASASTSGSGDETMARSPSGISIVSSSSLPRPGLLRRRSTDTSGGLDYYWSSLAGAGASSSSSSLAVSTPSSGMPSPSAQSLRSMDLRAVKSHGNLGADARDVRARDAREEESTPRIPDSFQTTSSYPSALPIPTKTPQDNLQSAWSPSSEDQSSAHHPGSSSSSSPSLRSGHSPLHSGHSSLHSGSVHSSNHSGSSDSAYSPLDYRGEMHSFEGEIRRALLDPSTSTDRDSGSTFVPDLHQTPLAPAYQERPDLRPPHLTFNQTIRESSPTSSGHGSTPTRTAKPSTFYPEPTSRNSPSRADTTPNSAPASKSDFGEIPGEDEDTLKGRNRRTLPASASALTGITINTLLSPSKDQLLSPAKGDRRSPSPGRSPEPPPRSALRAQYLAQVDTTSTPGSIKQPLPTIINTSYSPVPSPDTNKPHPPRPDRSPDRQYSPMFPSSATINDLTEMLGGAIDAIGLIDSRDTPPPTISEPQKPLSLGPLAPAAEVNDDPITPTSLPMRGASLPGPSTQSRPSRTPSIVSSASSHIPAQSPTMSISARPWPAAMLYGNVKTMKHTGDRAKSYARAINELARSESGLKEWCAASAAQAHRPVRGTSKMSAAASLGLRANSVPSAIPLPYDPTPHMRNVSASSEFPMRADSYTAREISQRVMDPSDQPTALPPNLPYPQLQQHLGLKPSQSMQSMASFASGKKGFFSAIGRKGGVKKDSISLGPPGVATASTNKKDVRGLPISAPRSTSPTKVDGLHAPRVQASISAPIGPRGPRSFTPPPSSALDRALTDVPTRASLDTGLSKLAPREARGSIDYTHEAEVRQMADILPHAERGVLRGYLRRHGEPMQAIGAYLEDEKNGSVIR